MFDRFSEEALDAVKIAREQAASAGFAEFDDLHLLAGCCRAKGSLAARVLLACGQDPIEVCARAEARGAKRSAALPELPELGFTAVARKALELALEEARALGSTVAHTWIGTHHLLLGLLRSGGPASELLGRGGLKLLDARKAAVTMHDKATREYLVLSVSGDEKVRKLRQAFDICMELNEFEVASTLRDLIYKLEHPR